MYALRLTINKRKPVVAGAKDLGVISAIVSLVGRLGSDTAKHRGKPNMHVHLGGLTSRPGTKSDEHLNWLPHTKLKVGDRVLVEIIEADDAGRVVDRSRAPKSGDERHFYRQLKKQYFKLKKKYEPES